MHFMHDSLYSEAMINSRGSILENIFLRIPGMSQTCMSRKDFTYNNNKSRTKSVGKVFWGEVSGIYCVGGELLVGRIGLAISKSNR